MKNRKIVASLAAMTVLATSSLSFALTLDGAKVGKLVNNKQNATITVNTGSELASIESNANMTLAGTQDLSATTDVTINAGTADLGGKKVKSVKATTPTNVTGSNSENTVEDISQKQKCETLLYKQVA